MRAVVVDAVAEPLQRGFQMFFEEEARVIGADGDTHERRLYYRVRLMPGPAEASRTRNDTEALVGLHGEGRPTLCPRTYATNCRHHSPRRRACAKRSPVGLPQRPRRCPRANQETSSSFAAPAAVRSASRCTAATRRSPFACWRRITAADAPAIEGLLRQRIEAATEFRQSLAIDATAYRLIHGEADLLPSLIVDRYGDYLVVQALSQGMDRLLPVSGPDPGASCLHPRGILARNDPRARVLEGLEQRIDVLAGDIPETVARDRAWHRIRR